MILDFLWHNSRFIFYDIEDHTNKIEEHWYQTKVFHPHIVLRNIYFINLEKRQDFTKYVTF